MLFFYVVLAKHYIIFELKYFLLFIILHIFADIKIIQ